jgi:hypothetical protein
MFLCEKLNSHLYYTLFILLYRYKIKLLVLWLWFSSVTAVATKINGPEIVDFKPVLLCAVKLLYLTVDFRLSKFSVPQFVRDATLPFPSAL